MQFRKEWAKIPVQPESSTLNANNSPTADEQSLLLKCRGLCFVIGASAIGVAIFLEDIVAVMVNAAWILMLFLPATLGALLFNHYSAKAGTASIVSGMVVYFFVLGIGVPLKSAFLPGFAVAFVVYLLLIKGSKGPKGTTSEADLTSRDSLT